MGSCDASSQNGVGDALVASCGGGFLVVYGGLTKTVARLESRLDDSVRFWTAAAHCRFFTGRRTTQSGRGLPQSKTLTRNSFARNRLAATEFLKPL